LVLLILSTSNFIIASNEEIQALEMEMETNIRIIQQKVKQLTRLGAAISLLYTSALLFMVSALIKALYEHEGWFKITMLTGAMFATVALIFLFIHSVKAIQIRKKHLKR
jgi:threonine/homoserine/homoserine lactone efflux protein